MSVDLDYLRQWVGKRTVREDQVTPSPIAALSSTLDRDDPFPQLRARGRWVEVSTPAGKIPALLPPAIPASWSPRMDGIPALREHTESILTQLGYSAGAISRFRADHVI